MKKICNLSTVGQALAIVSALVFGIATPLSAAILVPNGDFETGASGFTTPPGYTGAPNPTAIPDWTTGGGGGQVGINPGSGAGDPFNNNGNDSTNVAFIQVNPGPTESLSQTISGLNTGSSYAITFNYNARAGYSPPTLVASIGGQTTTISNIQPVGGGNPFYQVTIPFTATGTSQALTIAASNASGGDATALLDNFTIQRVAVVPIVNPSFEANSNGGVGYGNITGWTYTSAGGNKGTNPGGSGNFFIPGSGGANATPPDGSQVAFMQGAGTLDQVINGLAPGLTYTLTFFDGHRYGDSGPGDTLSTYIGGVLLGTDTPNINEYTPITYTFTATSSSEDLAFVHGNIAGDQSIAIDDVSIFTSTVPEPSSLVAFCGLGAMGLFMAVRRRRKS
jgi:hypothetical protein